MDKTNNLQHFLTDLADTIRTVEGSSEPINAQTFSTRIASLSTGGGGGVPIVGSIEELKALDLPIGSLAVVAVPGTLTESSFRDLYQPDSTIIDNTNYCLTTPELLSGVSSLSFSIPPEGSVLTQSMVHLVPRTFSMDNMAQFGIIIETDGSVTAAYLCSTDSGYIREEYFPIIATDGILSLNQTDIDKINDLLTTDDWCYFSCPDSNYVISEEQFDTLDLVVKPNFGNPSTGDVYFRKDKWEILCQNEFNNLSNQVSNKSDLILKKELSSYTHGHVLEPNIYYIHNYNYGDGVSYTLKASSREDIYSEYTIQLFLKGLNSDATVEFLNEDGTSYDISWANGDDPVFEEDKQYIISIVDGFGVYAEF